MATLMLNGFETGSAVEVQALGGTASIQSSVTRGAWSIYSLRCNPATTATGFASVYGPLATFGNLGAYSAATVYYRFYFRYDTKPASGDEPIFVARQTGNATKLELRINSAGNLAAYDRTPTLLATGSTVLASGTWYRIEVKVGTGASAAWEVLIDGVSEISGTADLSTTNNGWSIMGKAFNRNGNTVDFYYDDCRASSTEYPGEGKVLLRAPSANGTYQTFSVGAGSGSHYQIVGEVPQDGDSSYLVSTLVADNAETEQLADAAADVGVISCAYAVAIVKRDGASAGAVRTRLRSGSTDSDTNNNYAVTAAYTSVGKLYDTDPATAAAWTRAGLNGCEVGVVEKSATNRTRLAAAYLMFDYVDYVAPDGGFSLINSGLCRSPLLGGLVR